MDNIKLPGKAARQGCRTRLPGKAAMQGCCARLPGKAAVQGCQANLPGKTVGQGCMQWCIVKGCRARLPGKAAGQICRERLAMYDKNRPWKDHFKSVLRSDQVHRQKNDLRSDQEDLFFLKK
jgi:hypothetical protein